MPGIGLRQLGGDDRLRALLVTGSTDLRHDRRTMSAVAAQLLRETGRFDVNLQWAPDVEVLVRGWDDPLRCTQVPDQWDALPGTGEEHPLVWTNRYGEGRVFATGIGHGPESVSHSSFQGLFTRGAEWAATGTVTLGLPEGFGDAAPDGDWWPTTLEPMVRSMYDDRKQGVHQ